MSLFESIISFTNLILCRKYGLPHLCTTAARALLPAFTSVCSVFMCPNNSIAASVCQKSQTLATIPLFGSSDMCTDVNACYCTWGLRKHHSRLTVKKIPCCMGESNSRQFCTQIFNLAPYQLSYSTHILYCIYCLVNCLVVEIRSSGHF